MSMASTPPAPAREPPAAQPTTADASARGPVLLLWGCAIGWLFFSSCLGLLGSMKFHAPEFLADRPWSTYGRVQPAQTAAFLYGFALQAGLGILLWMLVRLGRTRLRLPGLAIAGALGWNVGLALGIAGVLAGMSTGFHLLELPSFAWAILLAAYTLVGITALWTFASRRGSRLYVSQWFLLAAVFWFPWIFSAAGLLLLVAPVRGILQSLVNAWYANNLWTLWCGSVGLGILFHVLPKHANRPLNSEALALTAFWLLLLFGPWVGISDSLPLPAWISGVSTVFAVLLIVPLLAVVLNWHRTLAGEYGRWRADRVFRLALFGTGAWCLSMVLLVATSLPGVGAVTQFTLVEPARTQLFGYGFFAVSVFAAMYDALPSVLGNPLPSARLVTVHVSGALLGITLWVVPLAVGGVAQGLALRDPHTPFVTTLEPGLMALRIGALGELLLLAAHGALLLNYGWAIFRVSRFSDVAALPGVLDSKPVEVSR